MKPLKNPFLIAFVSIYTLIGMIVFVSFFIYYLKEYLLSGYIYRIDRIIDFFIVLVLIIFFVPGTYFIRLRQVNRHKDRRLKNLEEKKAQAISAGIYDADV